MMKDPKLVTALSTIFFAKPSRAPDHDNVAEMGVFFLRGQDVRHAGTTDGPEPRLANAAEAAALDDRSPA